MKRARKIHGDGAVFEYPRGSGIWYAQLPPDERGRRPKRRAASRDEAYQKLRELNEQRAKRLAFADSRQRLAQFLSTWLDEVAAQKVKPATLESYREICRLYITPYLGDYRLDRLREPHVQHWMNTLAQRVSPATVRNAYLRLRSALDVAKRWRLVEENVATQAEPPALTGRPAVALSAEDAQRLLDAAAGHRLYALYYLALRLGLREGELLGLHWGDVDLTGQVLHVRSQLQEIGGKAVRTSLKTKKSTRDLWLDDALLTVLQEHRSNQLEEKRLLGVQWREHGLVFASEVGTPIGRRNLLRHFKRLLRAAGLPHMRFHDLRHTAGSLMLAGGAYITDVSEVLGHSSPAITAAIYAHSYEAGKRRAIEGTARLQRRGGST